MKEDRRAKCVPAAVQTVSKTDNKMDENEREEHWQAGGHQGRHKVVGTRQAAWECLHPWSSQEVARDTKAGVRCHQV